MGAVQDAFAATSPYVYLPLDAGVLTDASGHGYNATASGTVDLTVRGMEPGTTAAHFTAGASLATPGIDLAGLRDWTMGGYVNVMPQAGTVAIQPVLLVGIAATAAPGRGPALNLIYNTGTPAFRGTWYPTAPTQNASISTNPWSWHSVFMTWTNSTKTIVVWVDGVALYTNVQSGTPVGTNVADGLQVLCNVEIVWEHIAIWPSVLTNAQLLSIGAFGSQWPYGLPSSSEGDAGGGGGTSGPVTIGPPQDAQLTNIEGLVENIPGMVDALTYISDTVNHIQGVTDATRTSVLNLSSGWDNYVSVTLPSLNAMLSNILASVTSTITDALGNAIQKSLGELTPWDDQAGGWWGSDLFDLIGDGVIDYPVHNPLINVIGIQLHATTWPPNFGSTDGATTAFEERLGDFLLQRPDPSPDLGPLYTEHVQLFLRDYTWIFNTRQSVSVRYSIAPGVVVTARWVAPIAY